MTLIISSLFFLSFAGFGYVFAKAFSSGAEVYSGTYSEETAKQFEDVFLFIPPKRIADIGWAFSGAVFLAIFLLTSGDMKTNGIIVGMLCGGSMGGIALLSPRALLSFLKKRRLERFNNQLVDSLIGMSNALKAGFSIHQAFETIVADGENPIAQEFDVCLQQTRVGVNFSDALFNLDERVGSDDLKLVVLAIDTARKTGGNLTEIFERIASTIRQRMRIENRIKTLTAQGKMQGIIAGCMPLLIGACMMIIEPGIMMPFLHSRMGIIVMVNVGLLILMGAMVIRKIIDIDV